MPSSALWLCILKESTQVFVVTILRTTRKNVKFSDTIDLLIASPVVAEETFFIALCVLEKMEGLLQKRACQRKLQILPVPLAVTKYRKYFLTLVHAPFPAIYIFYFFLFGCRVVKTLWLLCLERKTKPRNSMFFFSHFLAVWKRRK